MKKCVIVAVSIVAMSAFALQAYALTAPKIAGFELGEKIDVFDKDVRTARHLASPTTETLVQVKYTYFSCDCTKPTDGYDEVSIDVSTNKTVMCVSAIVKCKDEEESKRRRDDISAKLKAIFADRISDDGTTLLEVSSGKDYVDVEFTTTDFRKKTDENNRLAAGGKK